METLLMATLVSDDDLLLALQALQCGLIELPDLTAALSRWSQGHPGSMAQILIDRGSLTLEG